MTSRFSAAGKKELSFDVQSEDNLDNLIERVIWIDEGYVIAFVFDINANKRFP